jgi:hypothetical protein
MGEFECEGKIKFGPLPWDTSERLAQFSGNWLQYAPGENAIVARTPHPIGCPGIAAIPCELMSMVGSIAPELRSAMPGGTMYLRENGGDVLKLVVEKGELRVQWPCPDYSRPVQVAPEAVMDEISPKAARVTGWARFAGSCARAAELQAFVRRFDGLYPEGDLPSECEQNLVYVKFKDVNVGPKELIGKLQQLAENPESLQAEFEVASGEPESAAKQFRVQIREGRVWTTRPALWK